MKKWVIFEVKKWVIVDEMQIYTLLHTIFAILPFGNVELLNVVLVLLICYVFYYVFKFLFICFILLTGNFAPHEIPLPMMSNMPGYSHHCLFFTVLFNIIISFIFSYLNTYLIIFLLQMYISYNPACKNTKKWSSIAVGEFFESAFKRQCNVHKIALIHTAFFAILHNV